MKQKLKTISFNENENFKGTVEYELDFCGTEPTVMWYEVTRDNTTKKFLTEEQHKRIQELINENEQN